jgi:hypothetical protein
VLEHRREREDTLLHDQEALGRYPMLDRGVGEAESNKLSARYAVELRTRQFRNPNVPH